MQTKKTTRPRKTDLILLAAATSDPHAKDARRKALPLLASEFTIEAATAPAEGEKPKARKFTMAAYNGGAMTANFYYPVVVELSGLQGLDKTRPIFLNHDSGQLVGHTTKVTVKGTSLKVEGLISGAGDAAKEVVAAHDNGFPWQASIGARVLSMEFVREGVTAKANGQTFTGPINIARKSVLGEVSFVPLGADDTTSARIAATSVAKGNAMNFEQWLEAKGFTLADLSDAQKTSLKAMFDAENTAADDTTPPAGAGAAGTGKKAKRAKVAAAARAATDTLVAGAGDDDTDDDELAEDPIKGLRASYAAETKRIGDVRKICAGKHDDIEAKAIGEGWSVEKTELEVLRASRATAPAAIVRDRNVTGEVLEAALCLSGGLDEVYSVKGSQVTATPIEKAFSDKTLQAAHTHFRRGIGLQQILIEAAAANGYTGGAFAIRSDLGGVLRAAFDLRAGFSTLSLPGILGNTANKFLLAGFMNVENAWRMISSRRPVNDFKTVTSYRLTGDMQFEKVGPTGELKHGKVDEESYTNKADTYGKMFGITRTDIINDDLGALTGTPKKIGRGSALKLNDVFWTAFLDNASFFATGNNNYFTGAATNLQSSSLTTAVTKFRKQVDADGKPLGATPAILLTAPEDEVTANELFVSTNLNTGGSSTTDKVPNRNVHASKYEPISSAYLSNSNYTGYSTTAWYLLSNPDDISVIEVAFLNGREQPTVESADADFNVLGIQMRGYFDFGVSKQDYRGGVKSKGAA